MIVAALVLVGLVLIAIACHHGGDSELVGVWVPTVCVLAAIATFVLMLVAGVSHLGIGDEIAQRRALRAAAHDVGTSFGHDIYGRVADANMELASSQWYRRQWWAKWAVPAEWDTMTAIELPGSRTDSPGGSEVNRARELVDQRKPEDANP